SRERRSDHDLPVAGGELLLHRRECLAQRTLPGLGLCNQNHSVIFSPRIFLLLVESREKAGVEVRGNIRRLMPGGLVGSADWLAILFFPECYRLQQLSRWLGNHLLVRISSRRVAL